MPKSRKRSARLLGTYAVYAAEVRLVPPGTLPNDGKVIDDQRKYE